MVNPTPENPPAFPRDHRHLGHNGMNLRDWFAGEALSGRMSLAVDMGPFDTLQDADGNNLITYEGVAKSCYAAADAMLAERAKQ